MPDRDEAMRQIWHWPGSGHTAGKPPAAPAPAPSPTKPAPTPTAPKLTPAGPLKGTDTIMVTRDGGAPVAVPLSVVATYLASTLPKPSGK